jgi:uncharacterized protein (DUF924 family)
MINDVLHFWFEEITESQWWVKDEALDQLIASRFVNIHSQANACELYTWRSTAKGRLAEIIVLDQFSRNIFRDKPEAFASDALALALAQEAIAAKADEQLSSIERSFLYMPYMHSESLAIHEVAVGLFENNGIASNYDFEIKHKAIIERFGRYPHRNNILGRESTPEEIEFLTQPDSSF